MENIYVFFGAVVVVIVEMNKSEIDFVMTQNVKS